MARPGVSGWMSLAWHRLEYQAGLSVHGRDAANPATGA